MPTLLIRLCGPMQSWGTRSRWSERDSEIEPTLSGIVGLFCAASGVQREQPIPAPWLELRLGVRVDHEGTLERDYHTAGGDHATGIAAAGGGTVKNAVLSNRYYLADADFLCGLEHADGDVLAGIDDALRKPRWQLFLGRKSFLPSVPVYRPAALGPGVDERPLVEALRAAGLSKPEMFHRRRRGDGRRRFVIQCSPGETSSELRMDQPVADSFSSRRFQLRYVRTTFEETEEQPDA
jgi:CRISPR system Cascade subunit CasD